MLNQVMMNKKKMKQQARQPTLILFIANYISADAKKEEIFKTGKEMPERQELRVHNDAKRSLKGDNSRFCSILSYKKFRIKYKVKRKYIFEIYMNNKVSFKILSKNQK